MASVLDILVRDARLIFREAIMELEKFYTGLADIFEVSPDSINENIYFDNETFVWDSLAIVSTLALADECFGVILSGQLLFECESVGDIVNLIEQRLR